MYLPSKSSASTNYWDENLKAKFPVRSSYQIKIDQTNTNMNAVMLSAGCKNANAFKAVKKRETK